jgi:ADP-ribose pyrophosphatase YjhB (NUDIX family)
MELQSQFVHNGRTYLAHWVEGDPTSNLAPDNVIQGVHAICFYGDKIVIVYGEKKKYWTPPGGAIESGETYQEAVLREVREESNMKVLRQEYIGYQDVTDESRSTVRQVRSFCIVEPHGDFVKDPDGDITEVKLIDPKDFKQYVDWGAIGDQIMARALEMKSGVQMFPSVSE